MRRAARRRPSRRGRRRRRRRSRGRSGRGGRAASVRTFAAPTRERKVRAGGRGEPATIAAGQPAPRDRRDPCPRAHVPTRLPARAEHRDDLVSLPPALDLGVDPYVQLRCRRPSPTRASPRWRPCSISTRLRPNRATVRRTFVPGSIALLHRVRPPHRPHLAADPHPDLDPGVRRDRPRRLSLGRVLDQRPPRRPRPAGRRRSRRNRPPPSARRPRARPTPRKGGGFPGRPGGVSGIGPRPAGDQQRRRRHDGAQRQHRPSPAHRPMQSAPPLRRPLAFPLRKPRSGRGSSVGRAHD